MPTQKAMEQGLGSSPRERGFEADVRAVVFAAGFIPA